jgi:hypothetical protein
VAGRGDLLGLSKDLPRVGDRNGVVVLGGLLSDHIYKGGVMALLFTELSFGSSGRARALHLVHDGKCAAPPDTYTTVGWIARVYYDESADGKVGRESSQGMILRFRDDSGQVRPYFVWWSNDREHPRQHVDLATRLVSAAARAFETVGRPVMVTILDGGDV